MIKLLTAAGHTNDITKNILLLVATASDLVEGQVY
jgi:hypothetical protein